MLASVAAADGGVGDGDWCGRKGADTGLRVAVIPWPDVGDVTGDPPDPPAVVLFPNALLRLVGLFTMPLTVITGAVLVSTTADAVTVGPDSGAASSSLN